MSNMLHLQVSHLKIPIHYILALFLFMDRATSHCVATVFNKSHRGYSLHPGATTNEILQFSLKALEGGSFPYENFHIHHEIMWQVLQQIIEFINTQNAL